MKFIRPTARGWVAIAVGLATAAVGLVNPGFIAAAFTALIWAVILVSFAGALFSLRGVSLQREPCQDGKRGEMLPLPVTVVNHRHRQRQAMVVSEVCGFSAAAESNHVLGPLAPGEKSYLRRPVYAVKRGEYVLDQIALRGGDPAGLFARQRVFNFPQELLVLPETEQLVWLPLPLHARTRTSATGQPIGVSGAGQDLYGIREYRHTDGMRFIDWKATARQQRLMVREFEESAIHEVSIFLDINDKYVNRDPELNNFEYLVKVAASLVEYLSGMHCQLLFCGGLKADNRQCTGPAQTVRDEIMQMLTHIQPGKADMVELLDDALEQIGPNSILYCLTLYEPSGLAAAFETLVREGIEVRWLHAPRALFTAKGDERRTQAVRRFAARRGRLVNPIILSPRLSVAQILMQTQ